MEPGACPFLSKKNGTVDKDVQYGRSYMYSLEIERIFSYELNKLFWGHFMTTEIARISSHHLQNYDSQTEYVKLI
jgi:hypothetical protein